MPKLAVLVSTGFCAVAALATGGCDGPSESADPLTTTVVPPPAVTVTRTQEGAEPAPDAGTAARWTMPDLVGSTLQDAQDQLQEVTGNPAYYSSSHDLTGQDRNQVVDSNWQVCTQNVAPGQPFTVDAGIDFGVVKVDEVCP